MPSEKRSTSLIQLDGTRTLQSPQTTSANPNRDCFFAVAGSAYTLAIILIVEYYF